MRSSVNDLCSRLQRLRRLSGPAREQHEEAEQGRTQIGLRETRSSHHDDCDLEGRDPVSH